MSLIRRETVTPDAITGPRTWPVPYEGDDETPDDHTYCDGCAWCDQDHWRYAYADIHRAHDKLVGSLRVIAEDLLTSDSPACEDVGRELRALVRDAEHARQVGTRPLPRPRTTS